jgi:dTDP-4-dehydrorhamnose reductase/beta-phosphoglucomutase-like phosphatase (HAD superfamily)
MNILILGASGLLGRTLFSQLSDPETSIYGTYNQNRFTESLKTIKFNYITDDISILYNFISNNKINMLVNCIAERDIETSQSDWSHTYKINIDLVDKLIIMCNKLDIKLVQISTDYIYDGKNSPYSIDSTPNPLQNYGISKLIAEYRIINTSKKYILLRVPVLYSLDQKNFSESSPLQVVKLSLDLTLKNKHIDNFNIRYPTNVYDVSKFLKSLLKTTTNNIYNFSASKYYTKYEMIKESCSILNLKCDRFIDFNDISPLRPYNTAFNYTYTTIHDFKYDLNKILIQLAHPQFNVKDFFFLIDLDGTLLDTDIIHYNSYVETFKALQIDIDFDFEKFNTIIDNNNIDTFLHDKFKPEVVKNIKETKLKIMLNYHDINTIYNSEIFIDYLVDNKYNYCIVTNTSKNIVNHYKLKNTYISKLTNFIYKEDYIKPKPHNECWNKAIEKYYKNEKYVVGIENTTAGYTSLKSITDIIYMVKSKRINSDTYLFNDYNQILTAKTNLFDPVIQ